MEFPPEFLAIQEKNEQLRAIDAGISEHLRRELGPGWLLVPQREQDEHLNEIQRGWRLLQYFYGASIRSSGSTSRSASKS